MTMQNCVYTFAVAFFASIWSAHTTLETVWLKEVTARSQTDKRTHSHTNLPKELVFHLRRSSETLRRNNDLNPKADFYFAQKLNDGASTLVKSPNWETEDVAYYQDMENAAFITVRCVQQLNVQCERILVLVHVAYIGGVHLFDNEAPVLIKYVPNAGIIQPENGHIRIRDTEYELLPAANGDKSRNVLEFSGRLGKQYILKNRSFIQRDVLAEAKDAVQMKDKGVEQELKTLLRRFGKQHKEHQFPPTETTSSTRDISALHSIMAKDVIRQLKKQYFVKVAVLIDSGLWDMFLSMVPIRKPKEKHRKAMENIRQHFSYIMNGVNQLYKGIEDPSISIKVILADFIVFKNKAFPHEVSKVMTVNGTKYINAPKYLNDVNHWDKTEGVKNVPFFDHGMLFTRYKMYIDSIDNHKLGLADDYGVCYPGRRISLVESRGLFWTVFTAAHELGHNLGADHDGEKSAKACKAEDHFIMTKQLPEISTISSSRNPWIFSICSIEAFKESLKYRKCVNLPGSPYDVHEYLQHLTKEPGAVYNATEQCRLIIGRYSTLCETAPEDVCDAMRCTYPATGECMEKRHGAADGTECGHNRWCIKARCVPMI